MTATARSEQGGRSWRDRSLGAATASLTAGLLAGPLTTALALPQQHPLQLLAHNVVLWTTIAAAVVLVTWLPVAVAIDARVTGRTRHGLYAALGGTIGTAVIALVAGPSGATPRSLAVAAVVGAIIGAIASTLGATLPRADPRAPRRTLFAAALCLPLATLALLGLANAAVVALGDFVPVGAMVAIGLWMGALGGIAAIAVAITTPARRRSALVVAALVFLPLGVLGLLSVGAAFLALSAGCLVAAALTRKPLRTTVTVR